MSDVIWDIPEHWIHQQKDSDGTVIEFLRPAEKTDVSVVIPYSSDHTPEYMLREAIETVSNQTVEAEVIIVVDEQQRGPAFSRNLGISQADNRYVAFLDADDLWEPTKLERQLQKLSETGAGICLEGPDMSDEELIRQLIRINIDSLTPSVLIDRDKVNAQFEESLEMREDHLFIIEATNQAGVCFCEDLVTVRKHAQGVSSRTRFNEEHVFRFWEILIERVPWTKQYTPDYWGEAYKQLGLAQLECGKPVGGIRYLLRSAREDYNWTSLLFLILSPLIILYYKFRIDDLRRRYNICRP